MTKKTADEFVLSPGQARLRGAVLRGYHTDVQLVGEEYCAAAAGYLMLPGNKGKMTETFEARARDAVVASTSAMGMVSRAYTNKVFSIRVPPATPPSPPKAG